MTHHKHRQSGFSLTEMLLATGIMAIGLVLIATIFPVGVKLTGMSAERSIAAVVADEAFAKVQLYGLRDFDDWPAAQLETDAGNTTYPDSADATYDFCDDFWFVAEVLVDPGTDTDWGTSDDVFTTPGTDGDYTTTADNVDIDLGDEFMYPSVFGSDKQIERKYHWSALCRRGGLQDVQVTVFVTHKTFGGMRYYGFFYDRTTDPAVPSPVYADTSLWPMPIPVNVQYDSSEPKQLVLGVDSADFPLNYQWDTEMSETGLVYSFFGDNYTIVNNRDGRVYRIFEMQDTDGDYENETIVLYDDWQPDPAVTTFPVTETIWVVPPGIGSNRYPCVGVFQKVMHFDDIN